MKGLCYVRPGWFAWLESITKQLPCETVYVSEHRMKKVIWLGKHFYKNLNISHNIDISISSMEDIIKRCRVLRNINIAEAEKCVKACWVSWAQLIEIEKPNFILSITVDSYIQDILVQVSRIYNIPFVGLTGCFVNGYFRLSQYGEHFYERNVSTEEVNQVLTQLNSPSHVPNFIWLGNSKMDFLKRWLFLKTKKLVYRYKKLFDPLNYEYQTVLKEYCADRFRLSNYYQDFDQLDVDLEKNKICYIPLHCFPEATVEYWTPNLELVDYYNSLYKLVAKLSKLENIDYILIKEHSGALGARPKNVYTTLKQFPKVKLLGVKVSSREIMRNSDYVISWNGTVCCEAALLGIPAFVLGNPFFYMKEYINKYNTIEAMISSIECGNYVRGCQTTLDRNNLVKHVLSSCLVGQFLQKGYKDKNNAIQVAESLYAAISYRLNQNTLTS